MKFTGVMKSTPGMLRWSRIARNSYWKPNGRGAKILSKKHKTIRLPTLKY